MAGDCARLAYFGLAIAQLRKEASSIPTKGTGRK
jgi:hypothetical protein